jgi:hypothetical protein
MSNSDMQKIINPNFKAPPPRNPTPLQQPEHFRRELKSFEDIHLTYALSPEAQRKSRHWLLRADYPQHTHTTICRIYRVKIRPSMFEDESGNVVPADKTPEQLIVYSLSEYVDNPGYVEKGGASGVNKISSDFYTEGVYAKHVGKFDYDERGNIINSHHMGIRNMFYIAYSPVKTRELLSTYEHDPTLSFACCISKESGPDLYVGSPRSIKNLDEFCNVEDIDGLIAASYGTFIGKEKGGYERWRKYRKKLDDEGAPTAISAVETEPAAPTGKKRQYKPPE